MEIPLVTCAEQAIFDITSIKLSLINIVEEMLPIAFPAVCPTIALVVMAQRNKNEPDNMSVQVIGKLSGVELFQHTVNIPFEDKERARVVTNIQGIVINGPGTLIISIYAAQKNLGEWRIQVHSATLPQLSGTEKSPQLNSNQTISSAKSDTHDKPKKK